ncbi:MAG: DOMON domain-containing protein [Candidatus Eisenbacteria bacterium]|nr:DOMON domain-containing protein [Candidatus Eisenbacteria bacterium]
MGSSTAGFNTANSMGITFRWKVEGALLRVIVVAPTRGWVGVGFSPSVRMQDANIILGYVVGGNAYVSDEYGSGPTMHQADVYAGGTNDVVYAEGREYNGYTEISFAIPLNSGDMRDRQLIPGRNHTVMLAYGPDTADEFTTLHATRTTICVLF